MIARRIKYIRYASIAFLVILYVVGLVGLQTDSRAWFLAATPLTLTISAAMIILNMRAWNPSAFAAMIICAFVGFAIEVLGVHTGLIFGDYQYGATLGWKAFEVPLVIGLNWMLLVSSTGTLTHRLRMPRYLQAAISATVMTALDLLIEPVAMRLDFWQWAGHTVPMLNYLAWWISSFVLLLLYLYLPFRKDNPVALAVLALQFIFFGVLNIFQ
jgi:bisanhydrobacterioruberin hydratase